jgi:hypothetical protein
MVKEQVNKEQVDKALAQGPVEVILRVIAMKRHHARRFEK